MTSFRFFILFYLFFLLIFSFISSAWSDCRSSYYPALIYLTELDQFYERKIISLSVYKVEQKNIMNNFVSICSESIAFIGKNRIFSFKNEEYLESEIMALHLLINKYPIVPLPKISFNKSFSINHVSSLKTFIESKKSNMNKNQLNKNNNKNNRNNKRNKNNKNEHLLEIGWELLSASMDSFLYFLSSTFWKYESYEDIIARLRQKILAYKNKNLLDKVQDQLNVYSVKYQYKFMRNAKFSEENPPLLSRMYQFMTVDSIILLCIIFIILLQGYKSFHFIENIQWHLWGTPFNGFLSMNDTTPNTDQNDKKNEIKNISKIINNNSNIEKKNKSKNQKKYNKSNNEMKNLWKQNFEEKQLNVYMRLFLLFSQIIILFSLAIYRDSILYTSLGLIVIFFASNLLEITYNRLYFEKILAYRFKLTDKSRKPIFKNSVKTYIWRLAISLIYLFLGNYLENQIFSIPISNISMTVLNPLLILLPGPLKGIGLFGIVNTTMQGSSKWLKFGIGLLYILISFRLPNTISVWIGVFVFITIIEHAISNFESRKKSNEEKVKVD